ncbi:nucleotide modification associated domain-containing protein [Blattabacterium cuenoti]|uniref:nucleotide modification associated domain-containing protein n=1 Tax=Blattabacterium cuenoti TaxID=1653831 RepID=UPI00163B6FD6|nr:nucleotide modification associated domain-containing protein [Blattabacterium cuenoti]
MKHTSIIIEKCRKLFLRKLIDYDFSWKVLKYSSIIDQIFIKVSRIKNIQSNKNQLIKEEKIIDTYIDIINYLLIILIKIDIFFSCKSFSHRIVMSIYNRNIEIIKKDFISSLNFRKNQISTIDSILDKIYYLKNNEEKISTKELKNYSIKILIEIFSLLKEIS